MSHGVVFICLKHVSRFPANGLDKMASGVIGVEKLAECGQSSRSVRVFLMFSHWTVGGSRMTVSFGKIDVSTLLMNSSYLKCSVNGRCSAGPWSCSVVPADGG